MSVNKEKYPHCYSVYILGRGRQTINSEISKCDKNMGQGGGIGNKDSVQ